MSMILKHLIESCQIFKVVQQTYLVLEAKLKFSVKLSNVIKIP